MGDDAVMATYYLARTKQFSRWLRGLSSEYQIRVNTRLKLAAALGHFGDHHGLRDADGIGEMRMDSGPGLRLYYTTWEYKGQVLLLLLGGDKSSQRRDIEKAKKLLPTAKRRVEREIDEELKKREGE